MSIPINELMKRFNQLANTDPRINEFGVGPLYGILEDIKYYPYLWIKNDIPHDVLYYDVNKYRAVEYNFVLRVGDKVNNQINAYNAIGENSNNGLDISSDTFTILLDMINVISEDSLGLFSDVTLVNDISVEPFFHEDTGDVNGHEALITLRTKITDPCLNPLTDDLTPPAQSPPTPTCPNAWTSIVGEGGFYANWTLSPVAEGSWTNNTEFVYYQTGITWADMLSVYGFPIDLNGHPELDLIYGVVPTSDPIAGNAIVIGTYNDIWFLYELHDEGYALVAYIEATTNDLCGLGAWDTSSSTWGLISLDINI